MAQFQFSNQAEIWSESGKIYSNDEDFYLVVLLVVFEMTDENRINLFKKGKITKVFGVEMGFKLGKRVENGEEKYDDEMR